MKCPLCGYTFGLKEESSNKGNKVCEACPFMKNCHLIRCSNCGYEWPKDPSWFTHKNTA